MGSEAARLSELPPLQSSEASEPTFGTSHNQAQRDFSEVGEHRGYYTTNYASNKLKRSYDESAIQRGCLKTSPSKTEFGCSANASRTPSKSVRFDSGFWEGSADKTSSQSGSYGYYTTAGPRLNPVYNNAKNSTLGGVADARATVSNTSSSNSYYPTSDYIGSQPLQTMITPRYTGSQSAFYQNSSIPSSAQPISHSVAGPAASLQARTPIQTPNVQGREPDRPWAPFKHPQPPKEDRQEAAHQGVTDERKKELFKSDQGAIRHFFLSVFSCT